MPSPERASLLKDVDNAIAAVRSAHDQELRRLTDLCQRLSPKTPEGRLNTVGLDLLQRMLDAGLQNKDIATALGISRAAVTRHYKQYVAAED